MESFSVSMPGADIGVAEIGSEGSSVAMPGAEIRTAEIGSEAAPVSMPGAEIGVAGVAWPRFASVIGVIDRKSKTIQTFKPSDKSWNTLHNITDEMYGKEYLCAVAVDQVIFALADDKTGFKFDLSKPTDGWIELPQRSEKSKSSRVQVVECCGQVYAWNSVNIEILGTDHTSWRQIRKPIPCEEEAITSAKGSIYTFGGLAGGWSCLRRSMKFDPTENSWTNLPDMPTARASHAASVLEDKIYVLGGWPTDAMKTAECFDVTTQKWTVLKPMNNQHEIFNAFGIEGKIYAVGSDSDIVTNIPFVIEEYDPTTYAWKDILTVSGKKIHPKATFIAHA